MTSNEQRQWKEIEQPRRHQMLINYLHSQEETLVAMAKYYGMEYSDEDYNRKKDLILTEIFSRLLARIAIGKKYGALKMTPLSTNWDFETEDGTHIEAKFRFHSSGHYPTDDIDQFKKAHNNDNTIIVYIKWDGVVNVYNILDFIKNNSDNTWTTDRTTMYKSNKITKERLQYNPKDAIWTTTITMPIWENYV